MAVSSMTGYGRAVEECSLGRFIVEIQSVNRKNLDVGVRIPEELQFLEQSVRSQVSAAVGRGSLLVRVFVRFTGEAFGKAVVNLPLAQEVARGCQEIASAAGVEKIDVTPWMREAKVLSFEGAAAKESECKEALGAAVAGALEQLLEMRQREGTQLAEGMRARLAFLKGEMEEIAKLAPAAVEHYVEKMRGQLEELVPGAVENDERILRESAFLAEKKDIAEEIERFFLHLEQFQEKLKREGSVGKVLEFLVVELLRELNTVASKASDYEISRRVVESKGEVERLREQVQNIE